MRATIRAQREWRGFNHSQLTNLLCEFEFYLLKRELPHGSSKESPNLPPLLCLKFNFGYCRSGSVIADVVLIFDVQVGESEVEALLRDVTKDSDFEVFEVVDRTVISGEL